MFDRNNNLRPQDSIILIKIIANETNRRNWNTVSLSRELYLSQSEVSEGLKRNLYAGLMSISNDEKIVNKNAFLEFLIYGIKYVFPVRPGPVNRGMPTAHSAPPLNTIIIAEDIFVWPDPDGKSKGHTIKPLYQTVPKAAKADSLLYEMLALIDAIRAGKARERNLAEKELRKRIMKRTKI